MVIAQFKLGNGKSVIQFTVQEEEAADCVEQVHDIVHAMITKPDDDDGTPHTGGLKGPVLN